MNIDATLLRTARELNGDSRQVLAKTLGVAPRSIFNWEKDGVPVHRNVLVLSKYGDQITAAEHHLSRTVRLPRPQPQEKQEHRQTVAYSPAHHLASFSTIALLDEVRRRLEPTDALTD